MAAAGTQTRFETVLGALHADRADRRRAASGRPAPDLQRERLVAEHALLPGKYQTAIRPDHGPGPIARNARRVHSTGAPSPGPGARPPFPEVETRDPALYDALCAGLVPA